MTRIEEVFKTLRSKDLKLCLAESFTGGGLCSRFVSLPGASDVLKVGLVCYSNEAKRRFLGVKEQTLRKFGAVSAETVSEMLDGLSSLDMGDVFAATSGNAGPTAEKEGEVGLFYIGVMYGGKKVIQKFESHGTRKEVIEEGIQKSIELIKIILE